MYNSARTAYHDSLKGRVLGAVQWQQCFDDATVRLRLSTFESARSRLFGSSFPIGPWAIWTTRAGPGSAVPFPFRSFDRTSRRTCCAIGRVHVGQTDTGFEKYTGFGQKNKTKIHRVGVISTGFGRSIRFQCISLGSRTAFRYFHDFNRNRPKTPSNQLDENVGRRFITSLLQPTKARNERSESFPI